MTEFIVALFLVVCFMAGYTFAEVMDTSLIYVKG